ncbi:IS605 OrfB family transposase, partial [Fusobacterium nucleatum CTI-6]
VDEITRAKLKYITIEDLKVSNMIKNKHLSKAIQEQNFYAIRTKLINKCKERNIELRLVDTFYPSSKTCSCCGGVKKDLKLNDRIYKCCNCGIEMDRDYNASINLEQAKVYKIIA